jgi:membrane fusion protein, multidrug efflux system
MKKRMFFMLLVVFAFLAVIGGFKFFQIKAAIAQGSSYQPPPEAVTTAIATTEQWDTTVKAIGSVAAVNGVTISADLPGVVSEIDFDSGRSVSKGDILVRLDTKQEQAQLAAAVAQRDLAKVAFERQKEMLSKGITAASAYDQAAAEIKSAEANVAQIQATIERKTIRAPFSGVLGIRQVNLGQYLAGGAPIVPLQSVRPVYVNFTVPQQQIGLLSIGSPVKIDTGDVGKITAYDSVIDEATRNIRIQATFDNASGKLRPGMFVDTQMPEGHAGTMSISLPASSISYAPFGDSVFIVEDIKDPKTGKSYRGVRQQFVKLGGSRGDQVAVLTGVKQGEEVVTSGVFKLRPGAAVVVNNSVQPGNSPKPSPENS